MNVTRNELKEQISVYCREIENIDESQYADHQFSEGYLKRKEKLIRQQKKVYYPFIKTTGRRISAAIAAAVIMGTMAVTAHDPSRNMINDFCLNIHSSFSEISFVGNDEDAPKTIEDIYEITYDLSGFSVNYEDYDESSIIKRYGKGDLDIIYYQYVKSRFNIGINTEGAKISSVNIGDIEAIFFINHLNDSTVIWDNGEYIIMIITNLSKNELIEIAESVQKVE